MTLWQKLEIQEGTVGRVESMHQSFATLKNQDVRIGLRKIVACSQPCLRCLLVPPVFAMVSFLHPTSCFTNFLMYSHVDTYCYISHTYQSGTSTYIYYAEVAPSLPRPECECARTWTNMADVE